MHVHLHVRLSTVSRDGLLNAADNCPSVANADQVGGNVVQQHACLTPLVPMALQVVERVCHGGVTGGGAGVRGGAEDTHPRLQVCLLAIPIVVAAGYGWRRRWGRV